MLMNKPNNVNLNEIINGADKKRLNLNHYLGVFTYNKSDSKFYLNVESNHDESTEICQSVELALRPWKNMQSVHDNAWWVFKNNFYESNIIVQHFKRGNYLRYSVQERKFKLCKNNDEEDTLPVICNDAFDDYLNDQNFALEYHEDDIIMNFEADTKKADERSFSSYLNSTYKVKKLNTTFSEQENYSEKCFRIKHPQLDQYYDFVFLIDSLMEFAERKNDFEINFHISKQDKKVHLIENSKIVDETVKFFKKIIHFVENTDSSEASCSSFEILQTKKQTMMMNFNMFTNIINFLDKIITKIAGQDVTKTIKYQESDKETQTHMRTLEGVELESAEFEQ